MTATFELPSIQIGGTNPRYGKPLGYVTADLAQPMVVFHLWHGTDPETQHWPSHEEPLLLAVRCGDIDIADSLTFTPQNRNRRPKDDGREECH